MKDEDHIRDGKKFGGANVPPAEGYTNRLKPIETYVDNFRP